MAALNALQAGTVMAARLQVPSFIIYARHSPHSFGTIRTSTYGTKNDPEGKRARGASPRVAAPSSTSVEVAGTNRAAGTEDQPR